MAELKIPQKTLQDNFNLQDFKDDFNALNEEIAETKEELTNLENAKGTVDSNLNVYGDIKLFNTERVSNSEGDTILSSSESGKFIYFRPGGVNNANGQVVLKENEFVVENGLVVSGNVALNSGKTLYVGNTEYYEGAINNWAKNDNFVLHLNNGKCFVPSDGINRNNALGHPENPWNDIFINGVSKNDYGYTKLPNGLIMQWGLYHCSGGLDTGVYTIQFPITFPNKVLNCVTSVGGYTEYEADCITNSKIIEWYNSNFKIKVYKTEKYVGVNTTWIAIGY